MKRFPSRLAITLLAGFLAVPAFAAPIATVNGVAIPAERAESMIAEQRAQGAPDSPQLKDAVREELIRREVLAQDAARAGVDKRADVQAQMDMAKQAILIRAYLQDYIKNNPVSDADLQKEYQGIKSRMGDKEYKARHVLVETENEAKAVIARLLENSARSITLLDGDEVRTHLPRGHGPSRQDRAANVSRIGYVASEIVRHGGIAVCAPIAPYRDVRAEVRARVENFGSFIEIHVDTELATCEARDRKGLYAQARAGKIPHFTGISDPYEAPLNPELRLNGAGGDPASLATQVVALLRNRGLIEPATPA